MPEPGALAGVIAPILTPFAGPSLAPDPERYVALARRLMDEGCTGLAPFGTTGEATSLGLGERRALLEALVEGGIEPASLLPGTGLCSLPDTLELTRHALSLGCAGVMMLPPFYYKGVTDEGLFAWFARVIEAVASDDLRIVLYHIPPQAVIGFSPELVGRLREAFPDIVVGLKDSSGDWENTRALLEAFPGFGVLSGSEVFLLENLRLGGAGCITATGNVNARRIRALWEHWRDPDAEARQAEITAMRELIATKPMIPMLKQIVARRTDDPEWGTVRPPLVGLEASEGAPVIAMLRERFGFE